MPSEKPVRPLHTLANGGDYQYVSARGDPAAVTGSGLDHRHSRPLSAHRRRRRSYRIRGSRRRGRPAKVRCENDFGTIGKNCTEIRFCWDLCAVFVFCGVTAIVQCIALGGEDERT